MRHSRATGTARLVLWGIASHDGDGGAWPSIATLSIYANVHPRNVQRALEKLVELGEIRRLPHAGGSASTPDHLRPNLYEFLLKCPAHCDGSKNHRDRRKTLPTLAGPTFSTPPAETSPGGGGATPPVAVAPPHPLAPAPPEQVLKNQPIEDLSPTQVSPDRARVKAACVAVRQTGAHDLLESGYCSVCAARIESSAS